jgi:hypothetical protein
MSEPKYQGCIIKIKLSLVAASDLLFLRRKRRESFVLAKVRGLRIRDVGETVTDNPPLKNRLPSRTASTAANSSLPTYALTT